MESTDKYSPISEIEKYLSKQYDFRRNIITEKTEWSLAGANQFSAMRDRHYNSLYRRLQSEGYKISISNIRSLLNSDFVKPFDPFNEYFTTLPDWDGKIDYISELAKTVKTTNDDFWHECFKRWVVAMVGCAIDEHIENHTVMVFLGKQGIGKTTWHLNLIPDQLKAYRYSGTINPNNKDSIINLSECILINLDELESLNKTAIGELKEMITKSAIRVRRPYGYNSENMIRRASFTGSVNHSTFLNDTTGLRRFLCFTVTEIDYTSKPDLNLVYAQAYYLLKNGFKYWFDGEEIARITSNNERYRVVTVEEEMLLNLFEPASESDEGNTYTTTEIAQMLTANAKISLTNSFTNNLGKALTKHKFKRVKESGVYKYVVKRRTV